MRSLDISDLPPLGQDSALRYLTKAKSVGAKWLDRHEMPLLAEVEDLNHHDLMLHVERFASVLERLLGIQRKGPMDRPGQWMGLIKSWADQASKLRRRGWERLDYDELMRVVDLAIEDAFGPKTRQNIAERLAARNFFAGKIQDRLAHRTGDADHLPTRIADIPRDALTEAERDTLDWAKQNSMNLISGISDSIKRDFRQILLESKKSREGSGRLQQRLFDKYANLNADMRRIAVTETAASNLNSLVSGYPIGTVLEWFAWPNACRYCKKMAGRKIRIVDPADPTAISDWQNTVYAGKTNYGRSFAEQKITTGGLTPRAADELAGPAFPAHPHCRCTLRNAILPEGEGALPSVSEGRFAEILRRKRQRNS